MFTVELPIPPSSNMMFINSRNASGKGRFLSPAYKAWRKVAGQLLMAQWLAADKPIIGKPFQVYIRVNINHQSDVANREKAVTDLLVATIPGFPDDAWMDRLVIERDHSVNGAVVEVVTLA